MARTNIFKQIDNALYLVKAQCLDKDTSEETQKIAKRKLTALKDILAYVDGYTWLTKSNLIEKIKIIRACNFDYTLCEAELGMTEDALKSFVKRCNQTLTSKIGSSTLDLIINGNIGVGWSQFQILSGKYAVEHLVVDAVIAKLPPQKQAPINVASCLDEIAFLRMFSLYELNTKMDSLNRDKLGHLLYVLYEDNPHYAREKQKIVALLTGRLDMDRFIFEMTMDT